MFLLSWDWVATIQSDLLLHCHYSQFFDWGVSDWPCLWFVWREPLGLVVVAGLSMQHLPSGSSISVTWCGIWWDCWSWSPVKKCFLLGHLPELSLPVTWAHALSCLMSSCGDTHWSCCGEICCGRSIENAWHEEFLRWIALSSWWCWESC